jgi:ankyrin repeat protein
MLINIKDGFSLLYACEFGYYEIVKLLIENGADVNYLF